MNKKYQSSQPEPHSPVDAQRRRILGAALKIFAENGYHGTKISDIAHEAKVSYGLVHHYFGSKAVLFTTIFQAGLSYLKTASQIAQAQSHDPHEQLRNWIFSLTQSLSQDQINLYNHLVMQVLGAPGTHPPECVEAIHQFSQSEIHNMSEILMKTGVSKERSLLLVGLAINTLLGSQMVGTRNQASLQVLYQTGCHLLGISSEPAPNSIPLPPPPWIGDFTSSMDCHL